MEQQKHWAVLLVDTDSGECDIAVERIPPRKNIVDVLTKKRTLFLH